MHPFFEPLSEREAMLLMTTLTLGGSDSVSIFSHLPDEVAGRLNEKAQALLQIESKKRVPFMVKQMKQALNFKGLRGVEKVDPSWILQEMRGESPRTVAAILVSLPPSVVRSVLKRLPSGVRKNLPPKEEMKDVPVELVRSVRQIFESHFHAMPASSGREFAFADTIHLERKELYYLLRDLGLVELGQAFIAVGKLALAELCRRLPRSKAEELIMAVRRSSRVDTPDLKTAQRFLSRVVVNFDDTEEFFQKAGLWRIAKAMLPEGEAFQATYRQRMPRTAGELFDSYLVKAGEMEDLTEEKLARLQDSILMRVRELSDKGRISPRWAQLKFAYNDPEFEINVLAAEEAAKNPPPEEVAESDGETAAAPEEASMDGAS